jgi:hypothetical protein
MRTFIRTIVGVGLAVTGLVAVAEPATAAATAATATGAVATASAADETLPGLKAAVTARIDLRLAALNREAAAVQRARHLTDDHRNSLSTVVNDAIAGLTELKDQVAQETTLAQVRTDAQSMVDDYRVFLLVGPQVRLTIAGDTEQFAIDRAQQAHDRLAGLVDERRAGGADTTAAETDLADMQAAIEAAQSHLDGQLDPLLAITPGPDATAITDGVSGVRQALGSVRGDLRTAAAEGRAVLEFLHDN